MWKLFIVETGIVSGFCGSWIFSSSLFGLKLWHCASGHSVHGLLYTLLFMVVYLPCALRVLPWMETKRARTEQWFLLVVRFIKHLYITNTKSIIFASCVANFQILHYCISAPSHQTFPQSPRLSTNYLCKTDPDDLLRVKCYHLNSGSAEQQVAGVELYSVTAHNTQTAFDPWSLYHQSWLTFI